MEYTENHYWNFDETIYASGYLIGVDEVNVPPIRNITLLALLNECGCLTNNDDLDFSCARSKLIFHSKLTRFYIIFLVLVKLVLQFKY